MADASTGAAASESVLCSYCLNPINPAAKKCSFCLEFTASGKPEIRQPANRLEIIKALLECAGKLGIPFAIIFFLVLFHTDIEGLFARAQKAQFGANVITFEVPNGVVDLHPLALFWLMQAAREGEGEAYRYDSPTVDDFKALSEIQNKGLATFRVEERKPSDQRNAEEFGTKAVNISATATGRRFLAAIGLDLGKKSPSANDPGVLGR